MTRTDKCLWLVIAALIGWLALAGCESTASPEKSPRRVVNPADFAPPPPPEVESDQSASRTAADLAEPSRRGPVMIQPISDEPAPAPPAVDPAIVEGGAPRPMVADAMIGQVNGKALYASQVLGPITPQLRQLGQTLPRGEFRRRATEIIASTLMQIVTDALILGEAERDMNPMEMSGLQELLRLERQKLLNQYGQGSRAVADETLMRNEGRTLEQKVEDKRVQLVVQRYMQLKLLPKINVTKKDIRRYYTDRAEEFNPVTKRTVHQIEADATEAAEEVARLLAEGQPFLTIARQSRLNRYKPDQAGLVAQDVPGDTIFRDARNEELLKLDAGQVSPAISIGARTYWVYLARIDRPEGVSLMAAQGRIEQRLREQQFQKLSAEYRASLFRRGSYEPIEKMGLALVEVAMSRFARPEQ